MTDPLEYFKDLPPVVSDGWKHRPKRDKEEQDYPGKTPPKNRRGSPPTPVEDILNGAKSKTFRVNGVDIEFFTIGELARALGRKPVTIRMWEQRGWIPKANFRTPTPAGDKVTKGRRLYSRDQVEFLVLLSKAYYLANPKKANWDGFRRHVRQAWPTH